MPGPKIAALGNCFFVRLFARSCQLIFSAIPSVPAILGSRTDRRPNVARGGRRRRSGRGRRQLRLLVDVGARRRRDDALPLRFDDRQVPTV